MKLAQGEYVALEKIENAYSALPIISQIYVHGDSLQDYLIAIVIPDMDYLAGIASTLAKKTVGPSDLAALQSAAGDEHVKATIMKELDKQAKKVGLKGFESVKRIHLSLDPFTPENDTLTPTLKVKRSVIVAVVLLLTLTLSGIADVRWRRSIGKNLLPCTGNLYTEQRTSYREDVGCIVWMIDLLLLYINLID